LEQQLINQEQYQMLLDSIMAAVQPQSAAPKESDQAAPSITVQEGGPIPSLVDFLKMAIDVEASDVHLGPYSPPLMRVHGGLVPMLQNSVPLTPDQTEGLARQFLLADQIKKVEEVGGVDFCYDHPGLARFRASVVRQRRGWESVFRVISGRVRTMQ